LTLFHGIIILCSKENVKRFFCVAAPRLLPFPVLYDTIIPRNAKGVSVMESGAAKGAVIAQLRQLVNTLRKDYNKEYRVVLYTASGRIVCDLAPPSPRNDLVSYVDDPNTISLDVSADFDGTGLFDSQLVNVKNAVIYRSDSNDELARADQIILFADQIIGFGLKMLL
jgi:hypothetical protein